MPQILRMRVSLEGTGVVGPSINTFYLADVSPDVGPLKAFYEAIKAYFPSTLQITVPQQGDTLDVASGRIVDAWGGSNGGVVTGTGTAAYARGSGARVVWQTSGIRNGRRVRGSTFLVPLVSTVYATDGQVNVAPQTAITTAASNLITAYGSSLVIWSRPRRFAGGETHSILQATVPRNPTQLRSRRT